jgi:hypothetical protein
MPSASSQRIFLCYRREDAGPYALLLRGKLGERFGHEQVFRDFDSIQLGLNYVKVVTDAIASAGVVLVLIGAQWAAMSDSAGRRRLDQADDPVRFELRTALAGPARVIPVLLDGARMPQPEKLPADLQALWQLNYVELGFARYEYEEGKLFQAIATAFAEHSGDRVRPDPVRAARLSAEAERIARTIPDQATRAAALLNVATNAPSGDQGRRKALLAEAEQLVRSAPPGVKRVDALLEFATHALTREPYRAAHFLAEARQQLEKIRDKDAKGAAEYRWMQLTAMRDVNEAERVARKIKDRWERENYLSMFVVSGVAATDLTRALRIADSLEPIHKFCARMEIAAAIAPNAPDQAEQIARQITVETWRATALYRLTETVAATDPDRAERIALSIAGLGGRVPALSAVALAVAGRDRDRARRLVEAADRLSDGIIDNAMDLSKEFALSKLAPAMALIDAKRAERIAGSIQDPDDRDEALSEVVAVTAADLPFAERVARSIADPPTRWMALSDVAESAALVSPSDAERIALSFPDPTEQVVTLAAIARILNGDALPDTDVP